MPFLFKNCLKLRKNKKKKKNFNGIIKPYNDNTSQVKMLEIPADCDSTNPYVSENNEEQYSVDGSALHESAPNSANENEVLECSRNTPQNSNEDIEMDNAEGPEFSVEENLSHSSTSQVSLKDNQIPDHNLLQNSSNTSISNISGSESNGSTDIIKNVTITSDVFSVIDEINALKSLTKHHNHAVQENISDEKVNGLKLEHESNSNGNLGNTAQISGDFDNTRNHKNDNNAYSEENNTYPEETSANKHPPDDTYDFVRGLLLLDSDTAYQDKKTALDANCIAENTYDSRSINSADKPIDIDAEQNLQSRSSCLRKEEKKKTQETNVFEANDLEITQNSSLVNNTINLDLANELPDSHIQQNFQSLSVSYEVKQENENANISENVCESVNIESTHTSAPLNNINCITHDVTCPDKTGVLISNLQESHPDISVSVGKNKHQVTEMTNSEETHESKANVEIDMLKEFEGKENILVVSSENITLPQDKTLKTMCDALSETNNNCISLCTEELHPSDIEELPAEQQFDLNDRFDVTENEIINESTYKICGQENTFHDESINQIHVLTEKNAKENVKNISDIFCTPLCKNHIEFPSECLYEGSVVPQNTYAIPTTDPCRKYDEHANDKSMHISSKVNDNNAIKKEEYVNEESCLNLVDSKINEGITDDFLLQQEMRDTPSEISHFHQQRTSDPHIDNPEHCNCINVPSPKTDDKEKLSFYSEDLLEKTSLFSREIGCKNGNSGLVYFIQDFNINQQMECKKAGKAYTSYEIQSANEENALNPLESKTIEDIPGDQFLQTEMRNGYELNKSTQLQQLNVHSYKDESSSDNFQSLHTKFCHMQKIEDFAFCPENLPVKTSRISKEIKCKNVDSNLIYFYGTCNTNLETESVKEIDAFTPTDLPNIHCQDMHSSDYQKHISKDTHVRKLSCTENGENVFNLSSTDNDDEQKENYDQLITDNFYESSVADFCANNNTENNFQIFQEILSQEKSQKRRSLSKYSISSISGSSGSSKLSINDDVNEIRSTPTKSASFTVLPSGDTEARIDNVVTQDVKLHEVFPDERYCKLKSNSHEIKNEVIIRQPLKDTKVTIRNTNTMPRKIQYISKRESYSPLLGDYYTTDMGTVSKKKNFKQVNQYLKLKSQRKPYIKHGLEDLSEPDTYETEINHFLKVGGATRSKKSNFKRIETRRKNSLEAFKWQKLQAFADMKPNTRIIPIKKEGSFEFKISSIENLDSLKKREGRQFQTYFGEEGENIDRNIEKSFPFQPYIGKEDKKISTGIKSEENRNLKSVLEQKIMHRTLSADTENEKCSVTSINMSPARKRILNASRAIRSPKYAFENNQKVTPNVPQYKKGPVIFQKGNLVAYVTKNEKTNTYEIKKGFRLYNADLKSLKYKFYSTENINFDLLEANKTHYTNRAVSPEDSKAKFDEAFKRYAGRGRSNGKLISYKRSTEWLRDAGVVGTELTAQEASDAFKCTAGVKVALNKGDYRYFLKKLSRLKRLNYYDIYERLCAASSNRSTENSGLDKEYGYC